MSIENLIQEFNNFDGTQFDNFNSFVSSKHNNEIFPPYIPHVGKNYSEHKILMYGTAQSINKPWDKLINMNRAEKIKQMYDAKSRNEIWIAPYRIMLSIAGIYLYAKFNIELKTLDEIHTYISATNYYKFSLNKSGKKDINPNKDLEKYLSHEDVKSYRGINNDLATLELKELKPSVIISFNGKHINYIKKLGFDVIIINDPSWILRGGGGCLKKTGSWYKDINDDTAQGLVDSYANQLDKRYESKKEAVKIYLLKYYRDWKK